MDTIGNVFGSANQLWQYIKQYAVKAGREATRVVLLLRTPYLIVCLPLHTGHFFLFILTLISGF